MTSTLLNDDSIYLEPRPLDNCYWLMRFCNKSFVNVTFFFLQSTLYISL